MPDCTPIGSSSHLHRQHMLSNACRHYFFCSVSISSSLYLTTKLKCAGQYTIVSEGSASSNSCLLNFDLTVVAGIHSMWTPAVFIWSLEARQSQLRDNAW